MIIKEQIVSPFSDSNAVLNRKKGVIVFRKENFEITEHYYQCVATGEEFTTDEIDQINLDQVYNQYRVRFGLPFPNEIKLIREKYGLSATKMSEILGFGINSYRNYEAGEVPSQSNSKLIQLADDPNKFKYLVELVDSFGESTKTKVLKQIEKLIVEQKKNLFSFEFHDYLLGDNKSDEFSGYRKPSLVKLTEMVIYFTGQLEPWKTKMNKLLFYADFTMFKRGCYSMSGTRYRAINMGPVPNNFNSIFEYMANKDEIDIRLTEFPNGMGEQFKAYKDRQFNPALFNELELKVLEEVTEKFKDTTTSAIIELSHQESAWKKNEKERKIISYKDYGFDLSI